MEKKNQSSLRTLLLSITISLMFVSLVGSFYGIYSRYNNALVVQSQSELEQSGSLMTEILESSDRDLSLLRTEKLTNYDRSIKAYVQDAFTAINETYKFVQSNTISNETFLLMVSNIIQNISYANGSGYVFITWGNGTTYINKASGPGVHYWNVLDFFGVQFFPILLNDSKSNSLGNPDRYTDYSFKYSLTGKEEVKRSYALYFAPWDWVVGTGNYIVDINQALELQKQTIISNFRTQLGDIRFGTKGYPLVLDANSSAIVYHPNSTLYGTLYNQTDQITGENIFNQFTLHNGSTFTYRDEISTKFAYVSEINTSNFHYYVISILDQDDAQASRNDILFLALFEFVIVFSISVVILILVLNRVIKPVVSMSNYIRKVGQSDFTAELPFTSRTELGTLADGMRTMVKQLSEMVVRNRTLSEELASSAEELSSSAEEISSSSENIASSQQQISKGASNQVIAITETQKQFKTLSDGIHKIRDTVAQINGVSDLIRNISNQTNMLALNAAIEAARAGEAGRGFNVVADQVRKLAEESRKAVAVTDERLKEISDITDKQESGALTMIHSIDSIVSVAEETSASTEESAAAAEEQASSMELITSTSQHLLSIAEKIRSEFGNIKINTDITESPNPLSDKNLEKSLNKTISDEKIDLKPSVS